jgi:hypothetical protein
MRWKNLKFIKFNVNKEFCKIEIETMRLRNQKQKIDKG